MNSAVLLLAFLAQASLLQVQTVPWTPEISTCFPADLDLDGAAEIFVLEDYLLRAYGRRQAEPLVELLLPPNTSAIDVADIDHDGAAEIVAVQEERILAFPLAGDGAGTPRELFTQHNQYSHAANGRPFPCVLVVDRDGAPMIALPQAGQLEVRDLTGALMETYPVGVRSPNHLSINRPFSYWVNQHAQTGPTQALEFRISSVVSFRPLRTGEQAPVEIESPAARLGTPRQQRDAAHQSPDEWPWFAVGSNPTAQIRALYGASDNSLTATALCIRTAPPGGAAGETKIGPPRHYPGSLIVREDRAPDFNGDGFTDIILWKSRQPGLTASSLSRAASSQTWPLTITTHLFLPEKLRYAPVPSGSLVLDVPLAWWLLRSPTGPLRDIQLRDFNGDGMTDFGCFTDEKTLAIWTAADGGFEGAPAFRRHFSAPVKAVLLEADLEGKGSTTLAVESGASLYLIRPWSPLSDF